MAKQFVDIRFLKPIRDPNSDTRDAARLDRLVSTKGREFTVTEEGGWVKIKGKVREVWVSKGNIADALLDDVPDAPAKGGK